MNNFYDSVISRSKVTANYKALNYKITPEQLVHSDFKYFGKLGQELNVGTALARLPLGNCLDGDSEPVGKRLLS